MNIYEVYIVKKNEISEYEVKNTQGLGFKSISNGIFDNNFKVSINDYEIDLNNDYIVEDGCLKFTNPLSEGDKITIADSILDNVKIVTRSSYDKEAFQKLFNSYQKFRFNHRYVVNLNIKGQKFTSDFNTKYDPFFVTVNKIRLDTGTLFDDIPDERIANVIYLNSKEALELLGEDVDEIPTYAKTYVRYKTDIDLCYAIYLTITGKIGSYSKKIGDITVDRTIKLPYLSDMIGRFKELIKPVEDLMNGDNNTAVSYIKGSSTTYPVSKRGVF